MKIQGIIGETVFAFVMKVLAACSGFLLNIVLARLLGAEGTGVYYLALSCISIAIMVSQFGLGQTLLRFIAVSSLQGDWVAIRGIIKISQRLCLSLAFLVSVSIFFSSSFLSAYFFHNSSLEVLIQWMVFAIVPGALFVLYGYSLQALRKINESIFITSVCMPLLSALLMCILIPEFGIKGSIWSYVIASWATLFFSFYLWRKFTPQLLGIEGFFKVSSLLKSNIPLFWVSLSQLTMVWSSSIMLGMWSTERDVGLFNIANKTALLVSFILSCVNTVIAPKFASIYHEGNFKELQDLVSRATALMVVIAAPIAIIMIIFPQYIMSLFGNQFIEGANILIILAIGQFVYVVTGAVGYLLTMSGHERMMKNIMILCSLLIVSMNYLLIPRFGAQGAAIATSITLIFQNVAIAFVIWKIMGIVAIPYANIILSRWR
jgi:O-antigen/teichoic acid export membrane protein